MLKVFLVEDEIVIRENIQKIILWERYGFELVGEASDGEIALPIIRERKPDILITDIRMPFMDGLALSTIIKKEFPSIKIIIISGYDDFEYARQAIDIGVEQYLLKPITRKAFIEVLQNIREKYESENAQKQYYEKFQSEIQEYEQHSRCDFFEMLVKGNLSIKEIYERAEKLNLDILAECYNILIFTASTSKNEVGGVDTYSQEAVDLQRKIDEFFQKQSDYLLFRNYMFSYAVLIKTKKRECEQKTEDCIESLKQIFIQNSHLQEWFIAVGKPAERLSIIKESYHTASYTFAFRYMYNCHILFYDNLKNNIITEKEKENLERENINFIEELDINVIHSENLNNFLNNGLLSEVDTFVEEYFRAIGRKVMKSTIFKQYILLNIQFSILSFIQKIGCTKEQLGDITINDALSRVYANTTEVMDYAKIILKKTLELRDENVRKQYNHVLHTAITFIDNHYTEDTFSLNQAAQAANVSPNHFSALFSRNMGQTFIEYVTDLRMKQAKELLRCTDKRSSEIAEEVGYKDPHYFSFLFKKTQKCTPSEYRKEKNKYK